MRNNMGKTKTILCVLCTSLILSACNLSNTAKGGGIGAAGGAVLGALVGHLAGNTAIGAAVGTAVGAGAGVIIGSKMDKAKKEAEQIKNAEVQAIKDKNGLAAVKVTFDSGILFTTSSSTLSESAKASLVQFAGVLSNNQDIDVSIYGHTDNQPWRGATAEQSVQKNNALSLSRAQSVQNFLISCGVSPNSVKSVLGLGSTQPVDDNNTVKGRSNNRRVEIYMYASEQMIEKANQQAQ